VGADPLEVGLLTDLEALGAQRFGEPVEHPFALADQQHPACRRHATSSSVTVDEWDTILMPPSRWP
jgi:hypothetical protein